MDEEEVDENYKDGTDQEEDEDDKEEDYYQELDNDNHNKVNEGVDKFNYSLVELYASQAHL